MLRSLYIVSIIDYHFFFFNDTATTEIYTLSLHDALPISSRETSAKSRAGRAAVPAKITSSIPAPRIDLGELSPIDRKSTRLNSSHANISYAVFCLKKKKLNKYPNYIVRICELGHTTVRRS